LIETEQQRRWWFATHPEFSLHGPIIRMPRPGEMEHPGKKAFIERRMKEGVSRQEAEFRWGRHILLLEVARQKAPMMDILVLPGTVSSARGIRGAASAISKRRPARLPPKGTAARRKIDRDKQKGIELKQKEELADITAGGKGSGVWTEQELAAIRRDQVFPLDAQWHHNPTVANRPDLAADPKSVHVIRGGRKAHLRDGHDMDWRKPYNDHGND
jgi:hypothetical protein